MTFVDLVLKNNLSEAKEKLFALLDEITTNRLAEAKRYVAEDMLEEVEVLDEKRNPNLIKMGRITKIRRRIRRNAKGKIIVQKNKRTTSYIRCKFQ